MLDLTDEWDLPGCGCRQPPELAQKPIIRGFDVALGKRLRDVVTLRFFDIEADLPDPFFDIEIEHLAGSCHARCRQHRNHMKRYFVTAQEPNTGDRPVESAAPGAS